MLGKLLLASFDDLYRVDFANFEHGEYKGNCAQNKHQNCIHDGNYWDKFQKVQVQHHASWC